jgi:hypothetical protein
MTSIIVIKVCFLQLKIVKVLNVHVPGQVLTDAPIKTKKIQTKDNQH